MERVNCKIHHALTFHQSIGITCCIGREKKKSCKHSKLVNILSIHVYNNALTVISKANGVGKKLEQNRLRRGLAIVKKHEYTLNKPHSIDDCTQLNCQLICVSLITHTRATRLPFTKQ